MGGRGSIGAAQKRQIDGMRKRAAQIGVTDFKAGKVTSNGSVPFSYTNTMANSKRYGFVTKSGKVVQSVAAKKYFS